MSATRDGAIARSERYFDGGGFFDDLARRVAFRTESQEPDRMGDLAAYLTDEMQPCLDALGFTCRVLDNPVGAGPFLVAERMEGNHLPTVMSYGHGDVVRGYDDQWRDGLSPWRLEQVGERLYGRGSADNKGQHTINIAAMAAVIEERGALGFNTVILIETGEETSSPGLRELCAAHKDLFRADVFIASDGPRVGPDRPSIYMGSRGAYNFDLTVALRDGGHHSGNWGGLLANPGIILAHAIASLTTANGDILVPEWRAEPMSNSVRAALRDVTVDGGDNAPEIDTGWIDPDLTPAERVFGTNTFEVLAFKTGNPDNPVNAIPPRASAHCQIRFVVPSDPATFMPALRRHLDERGFDRVEITPPKGFLTASRLDPDHPWARWATASITRTTGKPTAALPNTGGSLPNDIFSVLLGLPTIWVPHSYLSCSQHAPDEHLLAPAARDGLRIMAGLFWDLGEPGTPA
jgi:acetylornithine deacetylase/succinyl-diaminopimelate desuccinylase-like protein